MRISVLGPAGLVAADGEVEVLASRRQRQVLAALALAPGRPVVPERLADLVWGVDLPGDPTGAVHTAVSRLRRTVGPAVVVGRTPAGYVLEATEQQVDAHAVALGEVEALRWWRGEPWVDLDHVDVLGPRARAVEARRRERLAGVERLLTEGRAADAAVAAATLVRDDPGREEPVALLMRALHADGRQADALAAFAAHRAAAVERSGLEPSVALRDLEAAIVRDERSSASPTVAVVPPSRAPAGVATPPSSLVGRERDLAAVRSLLGTARLVTLIGPGGAGKTRLATEVVAGRAEAVWLVELAGVADDGAVVDAVAQAVRAPSGDEAVLDRLVAALDGAPAILVLDNCEHVVDAAAALAAALVARAPELRVLATSREPLAIDGEQRWPVGGLAPDDAAALFASRVRSVDPTSGPTPELAAAICARVDHLPLGIELAAAAVPGRGVDAVLAALRSAGDLTATASRRRPARHRDLGALVRWSLDLLAPEERAVLLGLGAFAGSFGLDDASAVVSPDAAALIPLLVERSLVVREADGRFRLLETVRTVARTDVSAAAGDAVAARHRAWALRLAAASDAAVRAPDGAAHAARLDAALPDLRQAHDALVADGDDEGRARLCASLCWWAWSATVDEAQGWIDSAAELHPADPDLTASLRAAVCVVRARPSTLAAGQVAATAALEASGAEGVRPATAAHVRSVAADLTLYAGEFDRSAALGREGHRLAEAADDDFLAAMCAAQVALADTYAGRHEQAAAWLATCATAAERSGSTQMRAWERYGRGEALADRDPAAALEHLDACLSLIDPEWDRFLAGVCRLTRASVRGRMRATPEVFEDYADLLAGWQRAGLWVQALTGVRTLVELLLDVGDATAACTLLAAVEAHAETPRGADAARVADAHHRLTSSLDPAARTLAEATGRALTRDGTVTTAVQAALAHT